MKWIDAKHINKLGNDFTKWDTYYGTINIWSSLRDYSFSYKEIGKIGYIGHINIFR